MSRQERWHEDMEKSTGCARISHETSTDCSTQCHKASPDCGLFFWKNRSAQKRSDEACERKPLLGGLVKARQYMFGTLLTGSK